MGDAKERSPTLCQPDCNNLLPNSSDQPGMEKFLKESLRTQSLKHLDHSSGGCISDGHSYETDHGNIFVKCNSDEKVHM